MSGANTCAVASCLVYVNCIAEAAWHHRARYTVGKTMRDR